MPLCVQDPEDADTVHVLKDKDEKPEDENPLKKPRVETVVAPVAVASPPSYTPVVCSYLCSPVVVTAAAPLTSPPLQDENKIEAVAGSISAAAPAAAQAAPESAPKTALVVWIHYDGNYDPEWRVFRTTKEFAMKLDAADTRKPDRPFHIRAAVMSARRDPMSEQHQLLKDGIEHELLDEVDDDDNEDEEDWRAFHHKRSFHYDEHTVIVSTN